MAWSGVLARDRIQTAERTAERIREDIARTRSELAASVQDLRVEVHRTVDWRVWYRRHAGVFLIGAFTVGFIVGTRRSK